MNPIETLVTFSVLAVYALRLMNILLHVCFT